MNPIGFCMEKGERKLINMDMEAMPPQVYLGEGRFTLWIKKSFQGAIVRALIG